MKGKSAELKKTIKFAKNTSPTRLLVRKAGNKKTGVYSTTIVVFTLGDSAWDNGATSLGYGGTTAAGDSGTTTATATASFTGTTTVPSKDDVDDVVVTIVFENATLTGLTYSDFSVVAKDADGDDVAGLDGTVLSNGFEITGNTVTLNVDIANSKSTAKSYEKLEITLPTSLKIEGNTVVATK